MHNKHLLWINAMRGPPANLRGTSLVYIFMAFNEAQWEDLITMIAMQLLLKWTVMTRRARVIIKVWVYPRLWTSPNSMHPLKLCFSTKTCLQGSSVLGSGKCEVGNGRGSGRDRVTVPNQRTQLKEEDFCLFGLRRGLHFHLYPKKPMQHTARERC